MVGSGAGVLGPRAVEGVVGGGVEVLVVGWGGRRLPGGVVGSAGLTVCGGLRSAEGAALTAEEFLVELELPSPGLQLDPLLVHALLVDLTGVALRFNLPLFPRYACSLVLQHLAARFQSVGKDLQFHLRLL